MAKNTFYLFRFEDGYWCCVRGLSARELRAEQAKHGKLISKSLVG